ncbi:DUF421 domain-containing protein [Salibacterium salarium]|uniref:DUF421 domain-containing protein n=1 Tax=Salibacterium salarium TaxID=284579 RepID=A0A428MRV6_9BACI|nr:DUF421 domain-containing protein [Salibacterium salarium]RSL28897.1 DUF421 domain-containing protein [Salibacterium salarium]
MSILELAVRIAIAFLTMLVLTRMMGRKELSQMTFFNFVSGIAIGSIGATLVVNSNLSIRNGVLALVGWSIFTIITGIIDIRSKKARTAIEGQPIILIKNGQIMEKELKKVRLDVDALNALLREKNVFSLSDVDYAIFETDGKLSVMKQESKQPPTKSDLNIPQNKSNVYSFSTEVITDGQVITSNLKKLNLDKQWLEQQLHLLGVDSVSDVFYAEVQKDGTLHIDNKGENQH